MCVGCAFGCALDLRKMRVDAREIYCSEIAREIRVRHAQDFFADFTQPPPLRAGSLQAEHTRAWAEVIMMAPTGRGV